MRETAQYQLKLIDPADDFSPDPLNQNAQLIENAIKTQAAALASAKSDLQTQITAARDALSGCVGSGGKTARLTWGTYTGNGEPTRTLTFDFKPVLVLIGMGGMSAILVRGGASTAAVAGSTASINCDSWGDQSVTISRHLNSVILPNQSGVVFPYIAIGESL